MFSAYQVRQKLTALLLLLFLNGFSLVTITAGFNMAPQGLANMATSCAVESTGDNTTDYVSANASAIQTAVNNATAGDTLKVAGNCVGVQEVFGFVQTLYISQSVTIQGGYTPTNWLTTPDPQTYPTTFSALDQGRVIYVATGVQATVAGLILTDGAATNSNNGYSGGGLYNRGNITLLNSQVINSLASDNAGAGNGGGVFNDGTVTLTNSTITNNQSKYGGGIYNTFGATLLMTNSTLSGNTAEVEGGGLEMEFSQATITNSTISGNHAGLRGGGITLFDSSTLTLNYSTIANNTAGNNTSIFKFDGTFSAQGSILANCDTDITSLGYNLESGNSCGLTNTGDVVNSPTLLGPLTNNGGSTATHTLLALSPAIDKIPSGTAGCGTTYATDQHGLPRPVDGFCDKGAVETQTNFPPTAVADVYTTTEDVSLSVNVGSGVLSNDSDGDFDSFTAVLVTNVAQGSLTFNNNGSFTYNPSSNFNGTDSFTYRANDGQDLSAVVTVALTVLPDNDIPIATEDTYTTTEDVPLVISAPGILVNDDDVENNSLTAVLDTDVTNGALVLNSNGSFSYTPDSNFNGSDSFTYHANDGQDNSEIVTVNLTILADNDAPVAAGDTYNTPEETPLTIAAPGVLANDDDVENNSLTAVLDTDVANGLLVLNSDGSFSYTPNSNFNGSDSFTYHANDGQDNSEIVTVNLTVLSDNDNPVVEAGENLTATEGIEVTFDGSYTDPGRVLSGGDTILWDFGDGSTASGTLTPAHSFADNGVYTVTLTVTDSLGGVGTDFLMVMVNNAPPAISEIADISIIVGTMATFGTTYDDLGSADTHTVTVEWGDGVNEAGVVSSNQVSGSHIYDTAGVYTVTITLTDDDEGEVTETFLVTVLELPPTGFTLFLPLINRP